jgi:hypothetical protein
MPLEPDPFQSANPLTCPVCGQIDMVQNVSGLYKAQNTASELKGKFSVTTAGLGPEGWTLGGGSGPVNLSGRTVTALAARLEPPPFPHLRGRWGCGSAFLLLAALAGLAFSVAFFEAGTHPSTPPPPNYPGTGELTIIALAIAAVPGIPALLILVSLIVYRNIDARRARPINDAAIRRHALAAQLWGKLYYCARDNGVFWPGGAAPEAQSGRQPVLWTVGRLFPLDEYPTRLWQAADSSLQGA